MGYIAHSYCDILFLLLLEMVETFLGTTPIPIVICYYIDCNAIVWECIKCSGLECGGRS